MAIEKVVPVKQENAATGGDAADDFEFLNNPANPNEDALEMRGVYLQNDTLRDTQVLISRDASNNMTFVDPVYGSSITLTALAAGGGGLTAAAHKALRQLIHFIDEGPAEGFATNAYKTTSYTGILPTSEIWWEDNTQTQKIVELTITYSGILVATEVWKMYDTDGVTLLVTVTDTFTYTNIRETSRTRTIV